MTVKSDLRFEGSLALGSKNDIRNFVNFDGNSGKYENVHSHVLVLSIAYKLSATKLQKNDIWLHWRVIQTLKENGLFIWKAG